MNTSKLIGYLAAMLVLGGLAFTAFAAAVEWREGRPLHPPASVTAATGEASGAPSIARGAETTVRTAHAHLSEGARSKAMHAMDAALRVTEVGKHAGGGEAFKQAADHLKEARYALHMGRPDEGLQALDRAAEALTAAPASFPHTVPDDLDQRPYVGAMVMNVHGIRIAEVQSVQRTDGSVQAELLVGGQRDVLGLFDLGGRSVTLPAEELYFGKENYIGGVHLVAPVREAADLGAR